ncbi:MAG: cation diffusion facilitator family transporter [Myxococcota bacterium]
MHDHGENPRSRSGVDQRRLVIALVLAATYMLAEIAGGWLTGSLALLADAGHMFSDVVALAMSVVALRIAQRPATPARTYGYYRTEILAALIHGVLLVCVSAGIIYEATERLAAPTAVLGGPMLAVAAGGLLVNLVGLKILSEGRHESLNVRGAWLHVLSDALGSVGAMVAGALIWGFGWTWADPAASLLIGGLIVYSSWSLIREAVSVLMEGAPAHIDVEEIQRSLLALTGVETVHDLHVWTIASGMVSLTGHVVIEEGQSPSELLRRVSDLVADRFQIAHATIQIEPMGFDEPEGECFP